MSSNFGFGSLAMGLGRAIFDSAIGAAASHHLNAATNQQPPIDPNSLVTEITGKGVVEDVASFPVRFREHGMILYGPLDATGIITRSLKYNIILHHPNSERMFSLFRTDDLELAENAFILFKEAIPLLMLVDPALCEKSTLDKICQKLRENENHGWNLAHVAAYFDFYKCFRDQRLQKFINMQEGQELRTPLHVAIKQKNLSSVTELVNLGSSLDTRDLKGNTVIHIAASESSAQILGFLLDKVPEALCLIMDVENNEKLTPLHLACKSNHPELVKILLNAGANVNIASPYEGYPIHIAVKSGSTCSIQEIISRSPNQLNLKVMVEPCDAMDEDVREGGSPLHWSTTPEITYLLLDHGCDPNIVNNQGVSPLHIAAKRGCLKTTLALLCHHAYPDMKDLNGDTPLMYAARLCSRLIIQALLVFGADVNLINIDKESARHLICTSQRDDKDQALFYVHAVGAKRCLEGSRCTAGCKPDETFNGIPPEGFRESSVPKMHEALEELCLRREVETSRPSDADNGNAAGATTTNGKKLKRQLSTSSQIGGRLLCLDGGGIRGLLLTQMLLVIQEELGVPPVDLFDFVAGTSTGGILALGLATGKSVIELQCLYLRLKDQVFKGSRPYKSEVMDEFLKKEFGTENRLSSIRRPRIMVTTALVDRRPADLHMFRNYHSPYQWLDESEPNRQNQSPEEVLIWEAAKWTGAAPSYFSLDGRGFVDGGLVSNNPTLDALTELTQFNAALKAMENKIPTVVVSLGTGIPPREDMNASHYDLSMPAGLMDIVTKVPKIKALMNLLVDQATQTEGQVVERSRAWCASIGVPFLRLSPLMSTYVDLDETNDEVLVNLMWETRAYTLKHRHKLLELKDILLQKNGQSVPEDD